jgi:glycosyltransferase involved in cell wall biosynthesis
MDSRATTGGREGSAPAAGAVREVLVVCPNFHPEVGGYAHAGTQFVRALSRSGRARVTVVTWVPLDGREELSLPHVTVARVRRLPLFRYSILLDQVLLGLRLRRRLRRQPFDFVLFETFENPIALAIALWRRRSLRRVGVRIHGCTETEIFRDDRHLIFRLNRALQRRVARRLPNIFSTTRFYRKFVATDLLDGNALASLKNYHVIPNCVEVTPDPAAALPMRPPSSGDLTFLCLGRINAVGYNQKNFELVAQALRILKTARPEVYARTRVIIVGDGERKDDLKSVLADLGVAARCELIDAMTNREVHALQASASACILVSRYEGLSMFGLEALASGAPLIVSRGSGAAELVLDGRNGFLVDEDDPFNLAEALARLAAADLGAMRTASRRHFEESYDPGRTIEKFFTCIDLCVASRKDGPGGD